jgi:hypothetical protein
MSPHLSEVINNVERYSIEDVVHAAEQSLLPCDCEDPDFIELRTLDRVDPVRVWCSTCGREISAHLPVTDQIQAEGYNCDHAEEVPDW